MTINNKLRLLANLRELMVIAATEIAGLEVDVNFDIHDIGQDTGPLANSARELGWTETSISSLTATLHSNQDGPDGEVTIYFKQEDKDDAEEL